MPAKDSLPGSHKDVTAQVFVLHRKNRMGQVVHYHIEIAVSCRPWHALALQAHPGPVLYALWHIDFQGLEAACAASDLYGPFAALLQLFKRQGNLCFQIPSLLHAAALPAKHGLVKTASASKAAGTAEQRLEEVGVAAALASREVKVDVAPAKAAKGIAAAAKNIVKVSVAELLSLLPVRSQLIVHLALLGILQHVIGFVDFLEFFFGIFVTRIEVRVVFSCKFLKGPGDGVLVSGPVHAKHFVIILIGCHDSSITRKTAWSWPCLL